jgi:hypothetical protein
MFLNFLAIGRGGDFSCSSMVTKSTTTQKAPEAHDDILTMPLDDLKKRVDQALALFEQLDALLPGMVELTDDARRHASGRYRNGEAESLTGLLDVAAKKPAIFETLADKDEGADPTRFEPEVLRDRLERAIVLGPLVKAAEDFASPASDTRLHLGNLTRPVLLAMYEIVKPQAKRDIALATLCKGALDFYSALGRLAAATRKANKATPTAGA